MAKRNETEDKVVLVVHSEETKKIVLPDGMKYKDAMEWLTRKEEEDNRKVKVNEVIDSYPLDGALALSKAMKDTYGWSGLVPTPSFFGDNPPEMIGVRTGPNPNDIVQVPWGRMEIPGVDGYIQTGMILKNNRPVFAISGVVKRRHEVEVSKLAAKTRDYVARESIYRGRPIRVSFPNLEDVTNPDDFNPKFIDLRDVRPEELVFAEDVRQLINTNLFVPIERTQECRDHQIPLKRGILLAGPYGVGKTLTAYVAAQKCAEHGWTFIYLDSVKHLEAAIHFAQQYSPAMIFAEDIDQVLEGSGRDEAVNGILNTIDGVDTKGSELIVTLTTNHLDRINQAMLRPGRLDAVIHVSPPDAQAAIRLVKQYGRGLIAKDTDLTKVGEKLNGRIPAVIREVVERAKLGAIARVSPGEALTIVADDLVVAIDSMLTHLELLRPKAEDKRSDREKAAGVIAEALRGNGAATTKPVEGNGVSSAVARPQA